MHLFCLHHAGGTTASFAAWRFSGVGVTKLGYRGRDFRSVAEAADVLAKRVEASPSPRVALYGHSMGAVLAFEVALRLQDTGRVEHVFLAAAGPPSGAPNRGAAAPSLAATAADATRASASPAFTDALNERAREVLLEDLALLAAYPGIPPGCQLSVPATILYSTDDPLVPASESTRWASWCVKDPRLVEVSGGGHLFHRANPEVLEIVEKTLSPGDAGDPAPPGTVSALGARLVRLPR
jgi:medium-chain acyl-[acyl-carrier-protein] hydrolase